MMCSGDPRGVQRTVFGQWLTLIWEMGGGYLIDCDGIDTGLQETQQGTSQMPSKLIFEWACGGTLVGWMAYSKAMTS